MNTAKLDGVRYIHTGFLKTFFRYTRVKQDNAALTARIHMLEEHIRELEVLYLYFSLYLYRNL